MGDWLSVKEAAEFLNVSQATVHKWIRVGRLSDIRRQGRHLWLSRTCLQEQLQQFGPEAVRDLLTLEAAAKRYNVSYRCLLLAVQAGKLPCHMRGEGRYWRRYLRPEEVSAWLDGRARPDRKIRTPARRLSDQGPALYTLEEASQAVRRSTSSLHLALRSGDLAGLDRESLNQWLDKLFYRAGGTEDPERISLQEVAQLSGCSPNSVRRWMAGGTFTIYTNPEGYPILSRAAVLAWLRERPVRQLPEHEKYYSLRQISQFLQMKLATVQSDVVKGYLKALWVQGQPPRWMVAESALKAWMHWRNQHYTPEPPRGEELPTSEICQRYGCTADILQHGVRQGYLQPARRFGKSGVGHYWNPEAVADYLRLRAEPETIWTPGRIHTFTGVPMVSIRAAIERGALPIGVDYHPSRGPKRAVKLEDLLGWLQEAAPPYRKEVRHLSPFVSSKVAGKQSGLGQTSVVKALRAGELEAFQVQEQTGPRYYIPRYQFDRWLESRGLPPSWELEKESEWLRVADAAQLISVAKPTIQKWLSLGKLKARRRGRAWLVERSSLLEKANQQPR
jgi:excisionase family DNA binding protein